MMGKLSVAQMDAHVEELLVGLGAGNDDLTVSRCKRLGQAKARAKFGQITIPLVKSDLSYGTCLHEIGHFRGKRQGSHKVMEREAGAWDWAKANALVWTARMEKDRVSALASYNARHKKIDASQARERAEERASLAARFPSVEFTAESSGGAGVRLRKSSN